jgi:hypothetical protein
MKFVIACLSIFMIVSCQKEISWEVGNNTGGTGGGTGGGGGTGSGSGLLVKMVVNSLIDTTTFNYSYDNANRLITHTVKVTGILTNGDFRKHLVRDAQGRIAVMIDSSAAFSGGWDTTRTSVFYSGTTSTILYALAVTSSTDKDSIAFTYTGNNITKITHYDYSGGTYTAASENVYTYDAAGNIATIKHYNLSSGTPVLEIESTSMYDTKVSPWNYGAEGLLIYAVGSIEDGEETAGPNNVLTMNEIDHTAGSGTDVTTTSYTYFSNNKPSKGTSSYKPSGSPIGIPGSVLFYYQ